MGGRKNYDRFPSAEGKALNVHADLAPAAETPPRVALRQWLPRTILAHWLLVAGMLALAVPTMTMIARISWSSEQGAHGPLVLATGLWLIARQWPRIRALARPGRPLPTALVLVPSLVLYVLARITGIIELEGLAMYGALLAVLYTVAGGAVMRLLWFPLLYLAFILPPPDSLVTLLTQPLKIWISEAAVALLYAVGYPVAGSGVTIQIAQYQLLVAAACAGLNSIISLLAIGLFYVYIRHNAQWRYAVLLTLAILPVAILANFIRVILLILITYHFGDAAAQGFIHNFAGVTMFALALLGIMAIDLIASPLRRRLAREGTSG